jgi:pilus assembly protein CpaC
MGDLGARQTGRSGQVGRVGLLGQVGLAFLFLIIIAGGSAVYADDSVRLTVGRSTVVSMAAPIARVSLTSSDIADALVTSPNELLINGKMPGTISMFVWDRAGAIRRYEIVVQRDLARLAEQVKQLFPGENIDVQSNGRNIVLSGTVTNKDVIDRALNLASGYVDKKDDVVTLLRLQEGAPTNQVLLRVRFAEVSRSALTELGSSFFTGAAGYKDVVGRLTTQQYPAPTFDNSDPSNPKLVFSDFLNFFLFDTKNQLGTVIKALQTRGQFQSLAEPNLVAESGKEASFLAGGEFPIPIAQGTGANIGITVQFKEFGVRLTFTPTVVGDRVHLKVRPEVSALDFTNAVVLNGFRIPALTTRRTETELELQNGQTFAIAGLINNTMNKTLQRLPGIGDIPILGLLFRSEANQKDRTELVVMITPQILPNNSPGVTSDLPRQYEPYLPTLDPKKSMPSGPPAFAPSPRGAAVMNAVPPVAAVSAPPAAPIAAPAASPDPADAAAKMRALTATGPTVVRPDAPLPAEPVAATSVAHPLTGEEKKTLDRSRKQEHDRDEAVKAADGKTRAKQLEEQKRRDEQDKVAQDKAAKEQAKKDAEAAKVAAAAARHQAEIDKAANDAAEKRAAVEAKKQAELDKKNQKSVTEAEAKLKAAEAAYQSELAKSKKQSQ